MVGPLVAGAAVDRGLADLTLPRPLGAMEKEPREDRRPLGRHPVREQVRRSEKPGRRLQAEPGEKGRRQVDGGDRAVDPPAEAVAAIAADDQRDPNLLVVQRAAVPPEVPLAETLAVIRGHDHQPRDVSGRLTHGRDQLFDEAIGAPDAGGVEPPDETGRDGGSVFGGHVVEQVPQRGIGGVVCGQQAVVLLRVDEVIVHPVGVGEEKYRPAGGLADQLPGEAEVLRQHGRTAVEQGTGPLEAVEAGGDAESGVEPPTLGGRCGEEARVPERPGQRRPGVGNPRALIGGRGAGRRQVVDRVRQRSEEADVGREGPVGARVGVAEAPALRRQPRQKRGLGREVRPQGVERDQQHVGPRVGGSIPVRPARSAGRLPAAATHRDGDDEGDGGPLAEPDVHVRFFNGRSVRPRC